MSDRGIEAAARAKLHFHGHLDLKPSLNPSDIAEAKAIVAAYLAEVGTQTHFCIKHDNPSTDMECDENGMGERACHIVDAVLLIEGSTE